MSLFDFIPTKIPIGQQLITKVQKSLFPAVINTMNAKISGSLFRHRRRTFFKLSKLTFEGSVSLETALAFPIVLVFFLSLFWMLELFYIHTQIESELYSVGNELVAFSYTLNDTFSEKKMETGLREELTKIAFDQVMVMSRIKKTDVASKVKYLNVFLSDVKNDNEIDIRVTYLCKPIISVPYLNGVWMTNHFYSKAYFGDSPTDSKDEEDILVYIADKSEVYHVSLSCPSIKSQISQIPFADLDKARSEDGGKYYSCSKCKNLQIGECVYITPFGNRYHKDINCSELKVNIYAVKLSEVKGRRKCKRCP